jgi:hypothetical protein
MFPELHIDFDGDVKEHRITPHTPLKHGAPPPEQAGSVRPTVGKLRRGGPRRFG